jgi:hypothetical protein
VTMATCVDYPQPEINDEHETEDWDRAPSYCQ